jgi:protein TonB
MENVISKNQKSVPGFDEIVFDRRNKEYGAYVLRKNYARNVIISLLIGLVIMAVLVIIPFLNAKAEGSHNKRSDREVNVIITAMSQPVEKVVVPETPPPVKDEMQQAKYVPPVVVDTVKPEDNMAMMTGDEVQSINTNEDVLTIPTEVQPEIEEPVKEQEPYVIVQEMPVFPGGTEALLKYIFANVIYPEICRENNVQGRVVVKFCVTASGGVDRIAVLKGVDPELDKEVVRVIGTLPAFRPGKQAGVPVPVWFTLPVLFRLDTR